MARCSAIKINVLRIPILQGSQVRLLPFLFLFFSLPTMAQIGGTRSFNFLLLTNSAQSTGAGAAQVANTDGHVHTFSDNPALLDSAAVKTASFSLTNYLGNLSYNNLAYADTFGKLGLIGLSTKSISYGSINLTNEAGVQSGTAFLADFAFAATKSWTYKEKFKYGVTTKFIFSSYERYKSLALAADIGGSYRSADSTFSIGVTAQNIGVVLLKYFENAEQKMPLLVQVGARKRLGTSPLRFSLLLNNLQQWDLTTVDPNDPNIDIDPFTGEARIPTFTWQKLLYHGVGSFEFMPGEKIVLRVGYNWLRRQELGLEEDRGASGISGGIDILAKRLQVGVGFARYSRVGTNVHLTLNYKLHKLG